MKKYELRDLLWDEIDPQLKRAQHIKWELWNTIWIKTLELLSSGKNLSTDKFLLLQSIREYMDK